MSLTKEQEFDKDTRRTPHCFFLKKRVSNGFWCLLFVGQLILIWFYWLTTAPAKRRSRAVNPVRRGLLSAGHVTSIFSELLPTVLSSPNYVHLRAQRGGEPLLCNFHYFCLKLPVALRHHLCHLDTHRWLTMTHFGTSVKYWGGGGIGERSFLHFGKNTRRYAYLSRT